MADVTEKLAKLAELFEKGLISREEFDLQKTALLGAGTVGRPTAIGSYRIVEEIGEGGMGVVYRVRHRNEDFAERQGGDVALKVLHAQYARRPEIVERFEREAALGIQLDHPGIVRVHELVVDGGQVALVMECVAGRPLSRMIGSETGPIPWERCRPMFEALVEAVDHAHAHGVIHRDLKPENIMVGPEGRLKILDFGIAKELGTDRTQTGTGMGTIGYMAPEQYTDAKSVDARADVYALGMTFYEMLAGRLPWEPDASDFRILQRKESGDLPPPTAFYPDVPPGVVDVVMRMLAPDPSDRYASCGELLAALESMVLEAVEEVTDLLEEIEEETDPGSRASVISSEFVEAKTSWMYEMGSFKGIFVLVMIACVVLYLLMADSSPLLPLIYGVL